jgi:hypothetical protein
MFLHIQMSRICYSISVYQNQHGSSSMFYKVHDMSASFSGSLDGRDGPDRCTVGLQKNGTPDWMETRA